MKFGNSEMNTANIDRLISSMLYEGYLLYPYRPSLKNAKRWTFGAVYPREFAAARSGSERSMVSARVLIVGERSATIDGEVRFLHLIERVERDAPRGPLIWHEAEERRIALPECGVDQVTREPRRQTCEFAARQWSEADESCLPVRHVARRQSALRGVIEIAARQVAERAHLVTISLSNQTPLDGAGEDRDAEASILKAFASANIILHVSGCEFISRIDPPAELAEHCLHDATDGLWPVLIGPSSERTMMLCSPIILYDYPEIAPESPGDFFDGTEIDEMLALRIMTLSDDEKLQMATWDARGRALLQRTDAMAEEQFARLHGVTRSFRPLEDLPDGR
jgi:hydrogenase maturation protease